MAVALHGIDVEESVRYHRKTCCTGPQDSVRDDLPKPCILSNAEFSMCFKILCRETG